MQDSHFNGLKTYKRLLSYVFPLWLPFLLALIGNACYSGIDAWLVKFLQPLLNKGFINQDQLFIKWLPVIIISIFIARAMANIFSSYFMNYVARSVVMVMRQHIFAHYQQMPAKVFDKSNSGHLLSAIIFNVQQVASAGANALTTSLQSVILIIGLLTVMFSISWRLTLVYFVTIPIMISIMFIINKRLRKLSVAIQDTMAETTSVAQENIDGYKVIRTFNGRTYESDRFDTAVLKNRRIEIKLALVKALSSSVTQVIAAIALATIITMATSNTLDSLSAGAFTALVAAMLTMLKPMKDLSNVNGQIQRGLAAANTVFNVLDSDKEKDEGEIIPATVRGDIQITDLDFSYENYKNLILNAIQLEIKSGEIVALVGRSGSGKSTLVNLLMRFYEYEQGKITLDQIDINDYDLEAYRQCFAYVAQQVVLFNDTVENNIAYGIPVAERDQAAIIAAAKTAHVHQFIEQLPNGYQSMMGDDGVLLSGGQRQRIALARAILKQAPILILDEATSALDTESEHYIQEALDKLMHQCTTIVIAHRLSTIKAADKIIVMDKGKIIEAGKHDELLAQQGHYAMLYDMQFKDN